MLALMAFWPMASDTSTPVGEFRSLLSREGWRSIEVRIEARRTYFATALKENFGGHKSWADRYVETDDGRRFYETLWGVGKDRVARRVGYGIGWDFAEVRYRSQDPESLWKAQRMASFMDEVDLGGACRPGPLAYWSVGVIPLSDALEYGDPAGEVRVLGRPCMRWVFPDVVMGESPAFVDPRGVKREDRSQDLEYCLDRGTGLPLKAEGFRDGKCLWRWEALSFDAIGYRRFPRRSRTTSFNAQGAWMVIEFEVREVAFDREYPDVFFWPERLNRWVTIANFGFTIPSWRPEFPPPLPR